MSSQRHPVYTLHCDGPKCGDEVPYEDTWGNVYFESDVDARSHAKRDGWRTFDDNDFCKDCELPPHPFRSDEKQICLTCNVHLSEHDNPDNIPVVLPGQLSLPLEPAGVSQRTEAQ